MKLFETRYDGQTFGYIVGKNGVEKITKKGDIISVYVTHPDAGKFQTTFDTSLLPMYTIG